MADKIELTKAFIEQELSAAPPLYVSVYLMTLATGGTAAEVAKKLGATETDVLYAWGYWKGKGYLQETEEKQENQVKCTHSASNYYNTKAEAIAEYDRIINEWSDKWLNNEVDDETYYRNCPDGYEIFSCPYCNKWTISLYY